MSAPSFNLAGEWLEPDGLGGFASGTTGGIRTRRYHGLLLAATRPPTERRMLVSGVEAWVEGPWGRRALSSERYAPDTVYPDGTLHLVRFALDPWPTWTFDVEGIQITSELFVPRGAPVVVLRWRASAGHPLALQVRPFLSGRDFHALMHENGAFRFEPRVEGQRRVWQPYDGLPAIISVSDGTYTHAPDWFRNFLYTEERDRGLDCTEDLAAPGTFTWDLAQGPATLIFAASSPEADRMVAGPARNLADGLAQTERARRAAFATREERSADAYLAKRGDGQTIIAGYPWFCDWGRDTFISLRGLCLATGRFTDARDILLEWADAVSEGMLPNRFPDSGDAPEYNSVDASLWYIVAVADLLDQAPGVVDGEARRALLRAVSAILEGYTRGTRHGIKADPEDGLLAAGERGVQLTWMDAKVGDWVVTPRMGKPVEVQALWLNALAIGASIDAKWNALYRQGSDSFERRFWNEHTGCLFDVVDPEDAAVRPNQILAVGGLPRAIVTGARAKAIVKVAEDKLLTPLGLRSLSPDDPGYRPRYEGDVRERDSAYHEGTVWPWLMGPFVEAWIRTGGSREEARKRFVEPLRAALDCRGLGHLPEIADAEPPFSPRGCPFQAWSLGELIRLERAVGVR